MTWVKLPDELLNDQPSNASGRSGALPTVCVLTPTLPSRRSLLDEATESVQAQTVPCEHLTGIDWDHEGPAAIRNRLADQTGARWLLPLDDDDTLDPDFVETLLPHLHHADIVYPWCRVEDHADNLEPWSPNRLFRPEPLLNYNFIPVTALIRHSLWDRVGGMPHARRYEDFLFWRKCLAAGARFKCVDEVRWSYRRGIAGSRNEWVEAA